MGKRSCHITLFKTQRFFMLDKCILKVKRHPLRSSGFHGICRIKVMIAAFLATLYSIVKLSAKREFNSCFIIGLHKTSKRQNYGASSCSIFESVFNLTPDFFLQLSVPKGVEADWRLSICCQLIPKFKVKQCYLISCMSFLVIFIFFHTCLSSGQRVVILKRQGLYRIKICGQR